MGYSANEMEYLNRLQKQKDMDTASQIAIQNSQLPNLMAVKAAENEYAVKLAQMNAQNTKDIARMHDEMAYKHFDMMYGNGGASDRRAQAYANSRLGAADLMAQGRMGTAQIGADGRLMQRGLPPMSGTPTMANGAYWDGTPTGNSYDSDLVGRALASMPQQMQQVGVTQQASPTGSSGQVGLSPGRMERLSSNMQASSYNPMLDPKMIQAAGLTFYNPDEFAAYVSKYSNPPPSKSPGGFFDNTQSATQTQGSVNPAQQPSQPQLTQQQLVDRGFQAYAKLKGLNYSGTTPYGSNGDSIARFTMKDGKTPFFANAGAVNNTDGIQSALQQLPAPKTTIQNPLPSQPVSVQSSEPPPNFALNRYMSQIQPTDALAPYTPTMNYLSDNAAKYFINQDTSTGTALNSAQNGSPFDDYASNMGFNSISQARRNLAILNGANPDTLPLAKPPAPTIFEKYSQYLKDRKELGEYANTQAYLNAMPPSYARLRRYEQYKNNPNDMTGITR